MVAGPFDTETVALVAAWAWKSATEIRKWDSEDGDKTDTGKYEKIGKFHCKMKTGRLTDHLKDEDFREDGFKKWAK